MATTKAMACLVLLATILVAEASAQRLGDESPAPPPATAPAPSPSDGQCTEDYLADLGLCVDFRLGRVDLRGKNLADERERCCRQVRGKPSAPECLCTAFQRADVSGRADFADDVNVVLSVCEVPEVSGLACPAPLTG